MKKTEILKLIKKLESVLSDSHGKDGTKLLRMSLESYKEPTQKISSSSFDVPKVLSSEKPVFLFTDGACRGNPGPGSYAYIIQNSAGDIIKEGAEAYKHTTNNKMEMTAVIYAIKELESINIDFSSIHVYTDSKYIVDGMKSWVSGWKKRGWKKADKKSPENLELWKKLDLFNSNYDIAFNWIKGHSGHPQNEYVDSLANKVLDLNGF